MDPRQTPGSGAALFAYICLIKRMQALYGLTPSILKLDAHQKLNKIFLGFTISYA